MMALVEPWDGRRAEYVVTFRVSCIMIFMVSNMGMGGENAQVHQSRTIIRRIVLGGKSNM